MNAKKTTEKTKTPQAAVTREQMLKQMGIKDEAFRDYLKKHATFLKSLSTSQKKFHHKNTPPQKVGDVAKSLGPDVTTDHIKKLFKEAPPRQGVLSVRCCST